VIARRTIDVSHLPPFDISLHAPLWWGQVMLGIIEVTMFAILIAAYFYSRLSVDVWPPPGEILTSPLLPTLSLLFLLISCAGSYLASEAAKRDDRGGMLFGLLLNLILGTTAVVIRIVDWSRLNFTWESSIHGSFVWAFLGLHTFDVVADLIFTLVLLLILVDGRYGPKQRQGVHVDSAVWYILAAVWIPIYFVIWWSPRL
jgi:heme/copper-type cytochrome/quinol oxidase subunit 3